MEERAALAQMRRQHGSEVTDAFARMRELNKYDEVDREEMWDIVQGLLARSDWIRGQGLAGG